jgi:hypothetical protein
MSLGKDAVGDFQIGDLISHSEMCTRERRMLQHGMNFRNATLRSVLLMSRRPRAPYKDKITEDGQVLIYEGHDVARGIGVTDPKSLDQPRFTPSGRLTPNGKFAVAAEDYKASKAPAELVRVYEKIKDGIWTFNGVFRLEDSWTEASEQRMVFKFRLRLSEDVVNTPTSSRGDDLEHTRMIPSSVKQEVYKRDGGVCVICGSTDNLHFDHDLPFSRGGTSLLAENIRLLCARHNLRKGAKVE